MKAIVTGGAGFIGSHMVDLLVKKKFELLVIALYLGRAKEVISTIKIIAIIISKREKAFILKP